MTYSSSLAMSRQRFANRNQNQVGYDSAKTGFGPISNIIILIILVCVLGLLYLTQVTKTNTYGYKINTLRGQATQLQSEHDDLEVASARLQSLERAKTSPVAANMVTLAPTATIQ